MSSCLSKFPNAHCYIIAHLTRLWSTRGWRMDRWIDGQMDIMTCRAVSLQLTTKYIHLPIQTFPKCTVECDAHLTRLWSTGGWRWWWPALDWTPSPRSQWPPQREHATGTLRRIAAPCSWSPPPGTQRTAGWGLWWRSCTPHQMLGSSPCHLPEPARGKY